MTGPAVTVVYDANVLYPAPLRDLLIRLGQSGLVRARWTETIHDEWMRSVLANNPHLTAERLLRTRALMNAAVRDCLVTGHEPLIDTLSLPDPDDRHVLAAAIHAEADAIVTYNLADFPRDTLAAFHLSAWHPDEFLISLLDIVPDVVLEAFQAQQLSLRNPPVTADELLSTLESRGLSQTVARLRQLLAAP